MFGRQERKPQLLNPQQPDEAIIAVDRSEHVWSTQEVTAILYGLLSIYYQKGWLLRVIARPYAVGLEAALDIFIRHAITEYRKKDADIASDYYEGAER